MTKYKCNNCNIMPPYTSDCILLIDDNGAKPEYCPIYPGCKNCKWVEVE